MNITAEQFEGIMTRIARIMPQAPANAMHELRLSLIFANDGNGHRLDLANLATFDDSNLMHDVVGVYNHASREHETCGKLMGLFSPRCGFDKEVR